MVEFLVIGGNGNVGRDVVAQLLDAGHTVRALVTKEARMPALRRPGVTLHVGDIGDADSLRPAMRGIERAYVATKDDERSVPAFDNFLRVARESGLNHVVRLSAMSADSEASSDLSRRHGERELALERSEIGWTHLRPTWFMQMMFGYAPGGVLALPGGEGRIPWIDTRDIAAVAVAALTENEHIGQTYEMTGPVPLTYGELAEEMSRATGRTFTYRNLTPDEYRDKLRAEGEPDWYIELVLQLYDRISNNALSHLATGVQEALNRQATSFARFCRDHADELVRQLQA